MALFASSPVYVAGAEPTSVLSRKRPLGVGTAAPGRRAAVFVASKQATFPSAVSCFRQSGRRYGGGSRRDFGNIDIYQGGTRRSRNWREQIFLRRCSRRPELAHFVWPKGITSFESLRANRLRRLSLARSVKLRAHDGKKARMEVAKI